MSAQIIEATPEGDRTLLAATSKELKSYGWETPCGNLPAAYLTGFLLGRKAKASQIDHSILDMGLKGATRGARTFAVLKGVLDADVEVPHGEAILPEDARIRGAHIATYAETLAQTEVDTYERRFATYLAVGVRPEKLPGYFQQVKTNVMERLKAGK
jgi:large subunit ribosomal protein L18